MHATVKAAHGVVRQILDFALPPRCASCGVVAEEVHRFCLDCWQNLHFLGEPCCTRCGLPFAYASDADAECGACLAHPPEYDRARAAVAYGDIARRVVLKLKYSGRPGIAETLAHFMHRHLAEDAETLLAPVPLHRWRIWKRGYNQSALVAGALAKRSGLACELRLLERVKATPPLKGKGLRERALTVRGAFRVPARIKPRLKGRSVLLIDDVYTTGATVNACARTLKRAGAARVEILCWARVVRADD